MHRTGSSTRGEKVARFIGVGSVLLAGWALWWVVAISPSGPLDVLAAAILAAVPVFAVVAQRRQTKARERARVLAEGRLAGMAQSCQELLWESHDSRFVYLGPNIASYLGYDGCELLGAPVSTVFPDFEQQHMVELVGACRAGAAGWTDQEMVFLAKGGELRDFTSSAIAQTTSDGDLIGFAGSIRGLDGLTDRRQASKRLRDIRTIIDDRQLRPVFQPIISAASGAVVGAEALTRFPVVDPPMTPEQWFTCSDAAGLGSELELAAIRAALDLATQDLPRALFLTLNISPATLLTGELLALIDDCGWEPARVVVEITEHATVEDYGPLAAQIHVLRERGARLAVDDAGAGYASFRHILSLMPDFIKLDRGLIAGIDIDPAKHALVKALLAFARDIGATVIAEGIETEAELASASALGVQYAQGYLIARPTPVDGWPQALVHQLQH